ncbi:MAG TPA: TonB family protein [bacterium]|nr:TonB family protein [bacterium]
MIHDRVEVSSFAVSMAFHLLLFFALSFSVVTKPPQKVAFITEVTLLDVSGRMGERGDQKSSVGVAKEQKRTATAVEKKPEAVPEKPQPDIKELLAGIERQKAELDMGITKGRLREAAADESAVEAADETAAAPVRSSELIAGGDPTITGQLAARRYKRIDWQFPATLPEETELMIEITVLSSGIVKNVTLVRASGYPELDRMAISQARKLQFDPLSFSKDEQSGILLFKFGAER